MNQLHNVVDDGRSSNNDMYYVPPGDSRNEQYRLATMTYFRSCDGSTWIWPGKGFYYIGYGSVLRCFSCGSTVDVEKTVYSQDCHHGDCAFANGEDSGNVPFHTVRTIVTDIRKYVMDHFGGSDNRQISVEQFPEENQSNDADEIDEVPDNEEDINPLPVEIDLGLFRPSRRGRHQSDSSLERESKGILPQRRRSISYPYFGVPVLKR